MSYLYDRYFTSEGWSMAFRIRAMGVAAVIFFFSIFSTFSSFRYLLFGEKTTATVTRVDPNNTRNRSRELKVYINAPGITEPGAYLYASADDQPANGATIPLEHIPGKPGTYREIDSSRWWFTIPFFASLVFVTYNATRFWLDFKRHKRRSAAADRDFPQYSR
jgi:hypothetical protein